MNNKKSFYIRKQPKIKIENAQKRIKNPEKSMVAFCVVMAASSVFAFRVWTGGAGAGARGAWNTPLHISSTPSNANGRRWSDVGLHSAGRQAAAHLEEDLQGRGRGQMERESGAQPRQEAEALRSPRGAREGRLHAGPQHQMRHRAQVRFLPITNLIISSSFPPNQDAIHHRSFRINIFFVFLQNRFGGSTQFRRTATDGAARDVRFKINIFAIPDSHRGFSALRGGLETRLCGFSKAWRTSRYRIVRNESMF